MPLTRPLSPEVKAGIAEAVAHFQGDLVAGSPGAEYLNTRRIGQHTAATHRLGYVDPANPLPGWERFATRIAIPYINASGDSVWIKFRATPATAPNYKGEVVKYAQQEGGDARLYNTISLSGDSDTLCLVEGEWDAITLTALGLTAVGIPGANNWKTHFARALQGYPRIVLFYDSDDAGRGLVKTVKKFIPDLIPISAPGGHNDVGDAYQAGLGPQIIALATGTKVPETTIVTPTTLEVEENGQEDTEGHQPDESGHTSGDVHAPGGDDEPVYRDDNGDVIPF